MKSATVFSLFFVTSLVSALPFESRDSAKFISLPISYKENDNFTIGTNSSFKRRGIESVRLDNQFYFYQADLMIGTPGQLQSLEIDTGSPELWVYDKSVSEADQTFDANKSSSYRYVNSAFNIRYAKGFAVGDWVTETVKIGNAAIKDQHMGLGRVHQHKTGVLGLGYGYNKDGKSITPYANVPQNLHEQGFISRNVFSLFLNDLNSSTGNLLFGAVDSKKYTGPFKTVDLTKSRAFFVNVAQISVDGEKVSDSFEAALDSGVSLSYLHPKTVWNIAKFYGAEWDSWSSTFVLDSMPSKSLTFDFGGITISVKPEEIFFKKLARDNKYGLAILPSAYSSGYNLLGATFLRSAYVVYDLERNQITLGQSSLNLDESNIIPVTEDIPGATHV